MAVNLIDSNDIKVIQSDSDIELQTDKTTLNSIINAKIKNSNTSSSTDTYSCDYIDSIKDTYSTSETLTNKVWIDNKPIYRKVVSSTSVITGGESTITTGLSNVSEYIKAEGFLYRTNSTCFPLSRINPSNLAYGVGLYIIQNDNTIRIETGSNVTNISKVVVVLEYTKTTD